MSDLNLSQIISEPTHFRVHCLPSCIDLIITDQPNLVLNSGGVRPSLDPTCKHQITFCKINFLIPPPPAYKRKIWHFNKADLPSITTTLSIFPWRERLGQIVDPSQQETLLNETILNIMSNFVPNRMVSIKPSEPEWFSSGISKIPRIPPLLISDKFVTSCKEKASLFNNFFVAQCQPIPNASVLPNFHLLTTAKLDTLEISNEQILNILNNLVANKAHDPDEISVNMIKLSGNSLCEPLKLIFRNILETGIFPKQWKRANVTPVFKKKNKQLLINYRPISLLPIFAKVFEKIIFINLYNYLVTNNLITKNQSGFRPGDSVTNQLIFLVHQIYSSFDHPENLDVRSVYLDMSKAFDKVWHEGLIFKLRQNGVKGKLISLLENYLNIREQRVVLNGESSDWGSITSGVPQGSVLGPLLFLVYINDLEEGIKSSIKFFADDTSLFSIVRDPLISAEELNHDLKLINKWAFQWKMSFNPDPTKPAEEIIFSHKRDPLVHPPLFFNDIEMKQVNEHKHLGLTLDSKLTFGGHI